MQCIPGGNCAIAVRLNPASTTDQWDAAAPRMVFHVRAFGAASRCIAPDSCVRTVQLVTRSMLVYGAQRLAYVLRESPPNHRTLTAEEIE
jgi:hypothetical protein